MGLRYRKGKGGTTQALVVGRWQNWGRYLQKVERGRKPHAREARLEHERRLEARKERRTAHEAEVREERLRAMEQAEREREPEMVQAYEVSVYGFNKAAYKMARAKDRKASTPRFVYEKTFYMTHEPNAEEIRNYLEAHGIYKIVQGADSGKPSLDNRVTIAGRRTTVPRSEVVGDWQEAI